MGWLFWAILSAIFAGVTAILAKLGVQDIDSNLATAIRTSVVLILAWAIALARSAEPLSSIGARTYLVLALSGIATGASWLCYFKALQLGEVSKVAPIDKLSIVVAMLLAFIFLGEAVTWRHALGALLIIAGSLVLATA